MRAALILCWLSVTSVTSGCARIHGEAHAEDTLLEARREVVRDDGTLVRAIVEPGPRAEAAVAPLRIQALLAHTCTTVEKRTVDRTEVTVRENETPRLTFWAHAAGVLGLSLLGVAALAPDPLRRNGGVTPVGGVAIAGALLAPFLIGGAVDDVRGRDERRHVGVVQEQVIVEKKPCAEAPYPAARVEVSGDQGNVAVTTDAQGRAELGADVLRAQFYRGPGTPVPELQLRVEGRPAGRSDALKSLAVAWADQDLARERARKAEQRRAVLTEELISGRCEAQRAEQMERRLQTMLDRLKAAGPGSSEWFSLTEHQLVVASEDGTPVGLDTIVGGELHLFVVGFDEVKLLVRDRRGNAMGVPDPLESVLRDSGPSTSRIVQANLGEVTSVKVVGTGCAMVLALRKY